MRTLTVAASTASLAVAGCATPTDPASPATHRPAAPVAASTSHRPPPSTVDAGAARPTAVPPPLLDRAAVAAAYRRFWQTVYDLDNHPPHEWAGRLAAVTATPLLPRLLVGMRAQHESGVRQYGTVRTQPVTIEIHSDTATLLDCQDASGAGEARLDTGLPITVGQSRTPFAATLARGADGRWRVSDARQIDDTC